LEQWHWSKSAPENSLAQNTDQQNGAAQYYGFCLNNGHHETLKRPREDWNAKILWKMRMELEYQWDLVEDEIPVVFDTLLDRVKTELNYLKDQLKSKSALCGAINSALTRYRLLFIQYMWHVVRSP
jgi:hypothetical protein